MTTKRTVTIAKPYGQGIEEGTIETTEEYDSTAHTVELEEMGVEKGQVKITVKAKGATVEEAGIAAQAEYERRRSALGRPLQRQTVVSLPIDIALDIGSIVASGKDCFGEKRLNEIAGALTMALAQADTGGKA